MHFSLLHGLLAVGVTASRGSRLRRQNGPTDPGIPSDCTWWDTAVDKSFDCDFFESDWGLTHRQFVEYNPSVKDDCSGIQVGHAYCVEVNNGFPRDEDPPKVTTTEDAEPEPTEDSKPSPTQDGLIDTCTSFYKAKKGDTCTKVISQYQTFDFDDFFKWNPAVEKDCSGIWADTYYCVGVPGTPTSPPTQKAATTTAAATGAAKPSPTQDGLIASCKIFYFAVKDDTCAKIVAKYGTFDLDTFVKWNPAVGKDCKGLWASTYYCVGVPGTPTTKPTTTTGGIKTPLPTQSDMVKNCNKFHLVKEGEKCSTVANKNNISIPDFLKWNPKAGSGCTGLKTNAYACVSVVGYTPTKPDNGVKTPTPTQPNMVDNCNKFHLVKTGQKCSTVANSNSISIPDFLEWNPQAGTGCTGLKTNAYACVWTINYKPTPVQGSSMTKDCKKYHFIAKGQVCEDIQKKYSVTLANLYKWNPAIGKDCRTMWAEVYLCVGV
ncbi:hypothetical protein B0T10DRAFT_533428 [Thelonectria olida]|uniref:LysM domain-containing protein n=1 Tax=Thelonectria olida TaxID=1576542 RepID=A0A9P8VTZ7_9HYPO|nr:hypothetical protein B0T10DRAFT_533428 [Thelonectria olida]